MRDIDVRGIRVHRRGRRWAAAWVAVLCVLSCQALADPPRKASIPVHWYGIENNYINQYESDLEGAACGPSAAATSFAYLQSRYAGYLPRYPLTPASEGDAPQFYNLVDLADTLARRYMGTTRTGGTPVEGFTLGKVAYLNEYAGKPITYHGQYALAWGWRQSAAWQADPAHAKPGFLAQDTKPTLDFLFEQISHGEDLEISVWDATSYLEGVRPRGHYLTVTGIDYDPATGKGSLTVIDPSGGTVKTIPIAGSQDGFVKLDYELDGVPMPFVYAAIAESVPEPSTDLLILAGLTLLAARARQAARRR